MKTKHLSDFDIQNFTFDPSECEIRIIEHIHSCNECKSKSENYLLLSSSIKNLPQPNPDFNVSKLILSQLTSATSKESTHSYFIYFLILLGFLVVVLTLFIFTEPLIDLIKNSASMKIFFIASTGTVILFVLVLDSIRSFNKRTVLLNK